jgi:hypothetical protein
LGTQDRLHAKVPIRFLADLNYINMPNERTHITAEEIDIAKENYFIILDSSEQRLNFGPRAYPLLRLPSGILPAEGRQRGTSDNPGFSQNPQSASDIKTLAQATQRSPDPRPGFMSFLGDTGTGKSWILRSLFRTMPDYPVPLSAPGKLPNIAVSTSRDVSLYADGNTSLDDRPLLLLDFEGLNGSGVPRTYIPPKLSSASSSNSEESAACRRHFVEVVYPRLAYAFSDCIVFLTTNTMQSREHIVKLITAFVKAANGSRYQSFKPSLVVIYNKFANNDSNWSVEASTAAFLDPANSSDSQLRDLNDHFDRVRVIKIPSSRGNLAHIAITQLTRLETLLREEHHLARRRRQDAQMFFRPPDLMKYLSLALRIFSNPDDQAPIFDWVLATRDFIPIMSSSKDFRVHALASFWQHCRNCSGGFFKTAWTTFINHMKVFFCIWLSHHRSEREGLAQDVREFQSHVAERQVPCYAKFLEKSCGGTRGNHRPGLHENGDFRWRGDYAPAFTLEWLEDCIPINEGHHITLDDLDPTHRSLIGTYFPRDMCCGCLLLPTATTLLCGHSFCETCVTEIIGFNHVLHSLQTLPCIFCKEEKTYHPKFLPAGAGYRLLSLDAGGVRGLFYIRVLQWLETQCFDIPIRYLFDFFIGVGVGGLLILGVASTNPPLDMGQLEGRFCAVLQNLAPRLGRAGRFDDDIQQFFESHSNHSQKLDPFFPRIASAGTSFSSFQIHVVSN